MPEDLRSIIDGLLAGPQTLAFAFTLREVPLDYDQYSSSECCLMAEQLFNYWISILCRDSTLLVELPNDDVDRTWREASVLVAHHFLPALAQAESLLLDPSAQRSSSWLPFSDHGIRGRANLCTADYGFDAAVERRMLSEYLSGVWNCHFMAVVGSPLLGKTPQSWDEFVYRCFEAIAEVGLASGKREHLILASMLSRSLALRSRNAVAQRDKNDFDFRDKAAGSLVVPQELRSLAMRSDFIVERYGESEVEVRFEEQLSLLMQSFGLIVVTTRRGQRRVDLICIAPGAAGEAFTLILEAKTTGGNYSLPTRDARAIAEYVRSVRIELKTLPPLRLVLVVSGSNHTKTIDRKLAELESECDTAVRYCDAGLLSMLRHRIPGPLNFAQFLRVCTRADKVLSASDIFALVEYDRATRVAHSEFVQKLLLPDSNL